MMWEGVSRRAVALGAPRRAKTLPIVPRDAACKATDTATSKATGKAKTWAPAQAARDADTGAGLALTPGPKRMPK